ncbi:MAG: hypothetical protein IJ327_05055, partial [Lachnospiraceae bacterium]|nr:hypothetical protein [Lachnospiraceae bacterium]
MKMVDITCSKCGATLKPDFKKRRASCEYCGASFLFVEDELSGEITTKAQVTKEERKSSKKIPLLILLVLMLVVFIGVLSWIVKEQSKPVVNPFDCITVSFHGKDGAGKVTVKALEGQDEMDVNRVVFDISKENKLMQGDTISIDVSSDYYRLEEKTKVYTVDGLDLYLSDLENLSAEDLKMLHKEAEEVVDSNLELSKNQDYFIEMKPVKLF